MQNGHTPFDASKARQDRMSLLVKMRPEFPAGGFTSDDGTLQFYTRVNSLLSAQMTVLDYGAGRGRQFDIPDAGYLEALQKLQGRVAKVIGVDLHQGIHEHPYLDERHVISAGQTVPVPPGTVDLIVADWVLEHLEDPRGFSEEVERLVRPGGWFCARTVNRWGYVGIGSRILPDWMHSWMVPILMPSARPHDIFPTYYRLNSLRSLHRWFAAEKWASYSYLYSPTPRYFGTSRIIFQLTELYQRIVPYPLRTDLFVFLRRK